MDLYNKTKNYRCLVVRYHGPTNHLGARFSITDEGMEGYKIIRYFPFSYEFNSIGEMAYKRLVEAGFKIVCRSCLHDRDILLCDNWGPNWVDITSIPK